jgi:tRNA(Ile)-lysidine synthase TilS/MesJ
VGKFRGCAKRGDAFLLACSGGTSVSMVHLANRLSTHQNLRMVVAYIDESNVGNKVEVEKLKDWVVEQGHEFVTEPLSVPKIDENVNNMEQLIAICRMKQLTALAKKQQCQIVVLGDTQTRLAIRGITDVSHGRGWGIPISMAEESSWFDVGVFRPFRDLDAPTLSYYLFHHKLSQFTLENMHTQARSTETIVEEFLLNLQQSYSGAVSNVARTLSKLEMGPLLKAERCVMCLGPKEKESAVEWMSHHVVASLDEIGKPPFVDTTSTNVCFACSQLVK